MKDDERKEIMRELVKSEQEVLDRLKEIVGKAREHIIIEETGKIIVSNKEYSLGQKICLYLIGIYFSSELNLRDKKTCGMDELKQMLSVEGRALSYPIGKLVKSHLIKEEDGEYSIIYHRIESIIDDVNNIKNKQKNSIQKKIKRKTQKKQKVNTMKDDERKEIMREFDEKGLKKICDKLGVSKEKASEVYDFERNEFRIIFLLSDLKKTDAEKQYESTLLYLLPLKYCYNIEEVSSKELRQKLFDMGLMSLVNLSTNLKRYRNQIIHKKGVKGSTDTYYKITIPGEIKAIKILKNILKNG